MTVEHELAIDITEFAKSNTIRDTRVYVELKIVRYKCSILKEVINSKIEVIRDE